MYYLIVELLSVKRSSYKIWIIQLQDPNDILLNFVRGCCGKCSYGNLWKLVPYSRKDQIVGSKIVPPLRKTVGRINSKKFDVEA